MMDILGMPFQAYRLDRRHWYTEEFAKEVDVSIGRASRRMLESYDETGAGAGHPGAPEST